MLTLYAIKLAVMRGQTVYWGNESYRVIRDRIGQWLIVCDNGYCCGLTWQDGVTMNGSPDEFYIADSAL